MNEQGVLEIAADHVEKDSYVVYEDFEEQSAVSLTGNMFLVFVRRCQV